MKLEILTKQELFELIRENTSLSEEAQVRQALEMRKLRLENQIGDLRINKTPSVLAPQ